jgi:hypothetical protein
MTFPTNPTTNQTHTHPNGVTYIFTGESWKSQPGGGAGSSSPPADNSVAKFPLYPTDQAFDGAVPTLYDDGDGNFSYYLVEPFPPSYFPMPEISAVYGDSTSAQFTFQDFSLVRNSTTFNDTTRRHIRRQTRTGMMTVAGAPSTLSIAYHTIINAYAGTNPATGSGGGTVLYINLDIRGTGLNNTNHRYALIRKHTHAELGAAYVPFGANEIGSTSTGVMLDPGEYLVEATITGMLDSPDYILLPTFVLSGNNITFKNQILVGDARAVLYPSSF